VSTGTLCLLGTLAAIYGTRREELVQFEGRLGKRVALVTLVFLVLLLL
jgi:hypothetical protein